MPTSADYKDTIAICASLWPLLLGEVNPGLLLVEDKGMPVVAGTIGGEGGQIVTETVARGQVGAADVAHHPVQIFLTFLEQRHCNVHL